MKNHSHIQRNLSIGTLAQKTGLSVSALRYYESMGLITSARRAPGGARYFDMAALSRLKVLRSLQDMGFALKEILQFLKGGQSLAVRRSRFVKAVRQKIKECDQESRVVRQRKTQLSRQLERCWSTQWRCEVARQLGLDEAGKASK